ncbi:MAG TPA: acyl-CoA dehydrogenase, partial [Acidimicrobiales bacterium]|nr:acyl-CoA dehydrogenase [Acidimicrobiales bacterium]
MHFAFDLQQLEFRAQLRALTEKQCTPADVRGAWDSERGWSPSRWRALADMGVVGLTVPPGHGGLGLGPVDLVLLLEELGWAAAPEPVLETTLLAVPVLAGVDAVGGGGPGAEIARRWLPKVADGSAVLAVGVPGTDDVPQAVGADLLVLERAGALHAVEPAEVGLRTRRSVDGGRRVSQVTWEPAPSTLLLGPPGAAGAVTALGHRAAMGTAAVLVGVADRMIALAARYAGDRVQFGKPIGSFQAVKHLLADALVRVEFARPAVYRAAWSLAEGDPDAGIHASMAKALASDAAVLAARTAL